MQACFPLTTKGVYLYTPFLYAYQKKIIILRIVKFGIYNVF